MERTEILDLSHPNRVDPNKHLKETFSKEGDSVHSAKSIGISLSVSSCRNAASSGLFLQPSREFSRSLYDIVMLLVRRFESGYFVGWPQEKIKNLPEEERPLVFPVTSEMRQELVPRSTVSDHRKLAFVMNSVEDWAEIFQRKLKDGSLKVLTEAKREAAHLWRIHNPKYDAARAVRVMDAEGQIKVKRTRLGQSEREYRRRLKHSKSKCQQEQMKKWLWGIGRQIIIRSLYKSSTHLKCCIQEIQEDVQEYKPSQGKFEQMGDIITYNLQQELMS